MTLDSLIAIAALAIAVFQVIPRSRQLELVFRMRSVDWTIAGLALLAVLYLQFYPSWCVLGFPPTPRLSRWGLDPGRSSFLVVVAVCLLLGARLWRSKLSYWKVDRFDDLVHELTWSESYAHLFSLLKRNLPRLVSIADGEYRPARLYEAIKPRPAPDYAALAAAIPGLQQQRKESEMSLWAAAILKARKVLHRCREILARPLAPAADKRWVATELLRRLLSSQAFAHAVAQSDPYLGLRILDLNRPQVFAFADNYVRSLMANPESALYDEFRRVTNVGFTGHYHIPPAARLLHYLFDDCESAYRLYAWRPVGDLMMESLDDLARAGAEHDAYNLAPDQQFQSRGRLESPLSMGVYYFDLMVSSALHQGRVYHMWLHYFPRHVEKIVRNYDPRTTDPLYRSHAEWPTRYSYLLYEILSALTSWIRAVRFLPVDNPNSTLASVSLDLRSNIPQNAVIALGQCLGKVIVAPRIEPGFKDYLVGIAFDLYFDLKAVSRTEGFAQLLLLSLRKGGSVVGPRDQALVAGLIRGFRARRVRGEDTGVQEALDELLAAQGPQP